MLNTINEILWKGTPILCVGRYYNGKDEEIGSVVRSQRFNHRLKNEGEPYKQPSESLVSYELLRRHYQPYSLERTLVLDGRTPGEGCDFSVYGKEHVLPPTTSPADFFVRVAAMCNANKGLTAAAAGAVARIAYKGKKVPDIKLPTWVKVWRWPAELTSVVIYDRPKKKP